MYGFSTTLQGEISEIRQQVEDALKAEGFGILTEINVQAVLKAKLGIEQRPYLILGACNPTFAHQAIEADPDVGLLLPCNVVIRSEADDSKTVAFMDPKAVLGLVTHEGVKPLADQVRTMLIRVRDSLGGTPSGPSTSA